MEDKYPGNFPNSFPLDWYLLLFITFLIELSLVFKKLFTKTKVTSKNINLKSIKIIRTTDR